MLNQLKKKLLTHQNILAVSKFQPVEKIIDLHRQGQIHFAENYIQEALEKIEKLKELHLKWHLIGPIQSNKVKFLKNNFEYIHSIDSLKIAELINKKAEAINYVQKVFIQINLSAEPTKSGFNVSEFDESWEKLNNLSHLKIVGLMTMPPLDAEAEQNRVYFKRLKNLALERHLTELSMGTSHDYEIALSEGATWVRLGTILFGERS